MANHRWIPPLWLALLLPACGSSQQTALSTAGQGAPGSSCTSNTSCSSGLCLDAACQSGQPGGTSCSSDGQCVSGACMGLTCLGSGLGVPSGGECRTNDQCGSGSCKERHCASGSDLPDGTSCTSATECASRACTGGVCGTGMSGGAGGNGAGGNGGGDPTGAGSCPTVSIPAVDASVVTASTPLPSCDANSQDQIGCSCTPGTSRACYTGPEGTRGVGSCQDGVQTCISEGELTGTYDVCTGSVTTCQPPSSGLCADTTINNEPEILAAYSPAPGESVSRTGQIKVWVNDEAPPFIAQGEQVDSTTGAITAPGDRAGKAADGYLFEPALYIAPATAESGGTPHFPQLIKGQYNSDPLAGPPKGGKGAVVGTDGAPIDPVPAGTRMPEKYTDEYVWNVCALGLAAGTYSAEFVIHDGDRDRAVGCVTIVIGP